MSAEQTQPDAGSPGTTSPRYRVLIVEDNPHIVEMYSYALKKFAAQELKGAAQLEVQCAVDGHDALGKLHEAPFDLVVTDLYMPIMDGFQLIERIREEPPLQNIPVVAISAGGLDARERALRLGVDVFLKKPVRFSDVMDTVKQLLRLH